MRLKGLDGWSVYFVEAWITRIVELALERITVNNFGHRIAWACISG
jgi:hypothetical protein